MVRAWREKTSGWVDVYIRFVYLGFIIPKKKSFEWSPPWHFKAYISHMFWHSIWHTFYQAFYLTPLLTFYIGQAILNIMWNHPQLHKFKKMQRGYEMNYPLCRVYPISSTTNLLEMVSSIEYPTVTIQCRIIFEYPIFSERIFRLFPSVQRPTAYEGPLLEATKF